MLALAAIGALTCAEVADHRDTAAVLFLASSAAAAGGPGLVQALGTNLPDPAEVLSRIRVLDSRLAGCPAVAVSASRPVPGSPSRTGRASGR